MRLSKKSRTRSALAAGLTTGAVGVALLVAPGAAFAAISVVPSNVVAPTTAGVTITDTTNGSGTPFAGGSADRLELVNGVTTCAAKYQAPSATILAVTPTGGSTSTVVFTVPAATGGTNGTIKRWIACIYTGAVNGSSDLEGASAGYPVLVGTPPTANPPTGAPGGGNTITVTAGTGGAIFTGVTTLGAIFTTDVCPAVYGTPTANTATAGTKKDDNNATFVVPASVANATAGMTVYNVCVYNGTTATSAQLSQAPYNVTQLNLSQGTGPYGGGNGLSVTGAGDYLAGIDSPGVLFTSAACPATYTETPSASVKPVLPANVRKLANNRMAITAPQFYASAGAFTTAYPTGTGTWTACVYNGQDLGSSTVAYSTTYMITTVPYATKVTPNAGPGLGGRKITVSGVNLPTAPGQLTAQLGGIPLNDITVINANAFTATAPMHAPANNVALVITTAAGSSTLSNAYSYTSTLIANPNTAPNTRSVDVTVNGVGLQSPAWNTGIGGAHIYLVNGKFDGNDAGSGVRANTPDAECTNVLPLSDTEAICTLPLNKRLDAAGAATLVTAARTTLSMTTVLGSRVVTMAVGNVSKVDIGMAIANNGSLAAGTTIVDVLDPTHFVASTSPTSAATDATSDIIPPVLRTGIAGTIAASGTTVTAAAGTFTSADIGRRMSGSADVLGEIITAVNAAGDTATINSAFAGTLVGSTTPTVALEAANLPVPEGSYQLTYVSNGSVGASLTDSTYVQSVISSASTFTVASF